MGREQLLIGVPRVFITRECVNFHPDSHLTDSDMHYAFSLFGPTTGGLWFRQEYSKSGQSFEIRFKTVLEEEHITPYREGVHIVKLVWPQAFRSSAENLGFADPHGVERVSFLRNANLVQKISRGGRVHQGSFSYWFEYDREEIWYSGMGISGNQIVRHIETNQAAKLPNTRFHNLVQRLFEEGHSDPHDEILRLVAIGELHESSG